MKNAFVVFLSSLLLQATAAGNLETGRWQTAIDRAADAGGGVVSVPAGRHVVGSLSLRNGVVLKLERGCVLEGSSDPADYPDVRIEYAELREPWQGLIVADGCTNVAVVGEGEIFGNGAKFPHGARLGRPQGLLFHRCRGVRVEGVKLRDLARWTCYLKECDGVTVRKVAVDSHANGNNDGIDIDSRNVLVEDCSFDCDDDGIVLKSDNPDFIAENVTVRNCRVCSTCSAIKLGTGSHGGFRNILVENVAAGASAREWCDPGTGKGVISSYRVRTWPGSEWTPSLLSGIALECVDGGLMEDVVVRNVTVERAATPIFIRGGLRYGRTFEGDKPLGLPFGRHRRVTGVRIENVRATATSYTASSITGVPGLRLKGVTLKDVTINVPGAGAAGAAEQHLPVPEKEDAYPESNMFDNRMLPAYGFYCRHVDGLVFDNVTVKLRAADPRREIVLDDVTGYERLMGVESAVDLNAGWTCRRDGQAEETVDLPHDGAIAGPFDQSLENCTGLLPYFGHATYVKRIAAPADVRKAVFLDVDGAMSEAKVFVNGRLAAERPCGYSSFRVPLDGLLNADADNEVRIEVDPKRASARWYPGLGLYRGVKLVMLDRRAHVSWHGICVRTEENRAIVDVELEGTERDRATWKARIIGEDGLTVRDPKLWCPEDPHLYELEVVVRIGEEIVDRQRVRFGFRTLRFDPVEGFFLNGVHRQMKGVCLHHDLGSLGAAFDRDAARRQLSIMKVMGCDAIRTSHNPPAEELLDLCDEMGLMVMDEAFDMWETGKREYDYARFFRDWHERDLVDFLKRDRNHPCIVMWLIGNEVMEHFCQSKGSVADGKRIGRALRIVSELPLEGTSFGAVFLNGMRLEKPFVRHADLLKGGLLEFRAT